MENKVSYAIAMNIYRALSGELPGFDSVEEVYAAIDGIYTESKGRVIIEPIKTIITSSGTYRYDSEDVTGYKPVEVTVDVAGSGGGGTGQFDFSSLGYNASEVAKCNNIIQSAIEYGNTIAQNWDVNNTNMDSMFNRDSNLQYFPVVDTSNVNSMSNAFDGSALAYIPLIDTSNVTNMYCAFHDCVNLKEIPAFDTSKVDSMAETFYHTGITFVPAFDTSNVTQMSFMFAHCYNLQTVPAFDTSNVESIYNMFANCSNLRSLPLFDFGNVVDCWTFLGETEYPYLTEIGGFKDFGKREELGDWQDIGLTQCPNLTHQSKLNVINNLYDRATAGYNMIALNFPTDGLTDEEIAIATNKGWTLQQ